MMTLVTCVTAACDQCGDHPDMDDVNPHFDTESAAIEWLREVGWRVFRVGFMVCPDCSVRHDCEVYGHAWMDWRDCRCNGRVHRHAVTSGAVPCAWTYRLCERCSIGEDRLPGSATEDDPTSDHPEPAATPAKKLPPVRVSQHPASEPEEITSMSDTTPEDQTADRPPSIAVAISELLKTMPGAGTSFAERIAWFEHKAEVLERIAAHEYCEDRAAAAQLAENSRRMAQTLRDEETGR